MKTAVAYLRYSSDKQTEQSIEGQMHVCQDYAKNNNIRILDYYIDRAMSAKTDNRREFQRMLRDSEKRAWDMVLVYKLDRFSRNKFEMAVHRKTLRDNGIKLISCMENIPDAPEGIILESMLEGMAEYYSAELSQKVHRGMNESRKKGLYTGGHIPFGYRVENQRFVVNESEAQLICSYYRRYLNGEQIQTLLDETRAKGILYNGREFGRSAFYRLFSNEKYTGIYRLNEDVFDNVYPRIVPQDLFDEVQAELEKNKYGGQAEERYLFKGKIFCGYCGKHMTSDCGISRTGEKRRYYSCSARKKGRKCKKQLLKKGVFEEMIIKAILETFGTPALISKIADAVIKAHEKKSGENQYLSTLLREQKQTQASIDHIISALEKGIVSISVQARLSKLEKRLSELEAQIEEEEAHDRLKVTKGDIIKYIKKAIAAEPYALVRLLIKKIVVFDDRVEVYLNHVSRDDADDGGITIYDEQKEFEVEKHLLHVPPSKASIEIKINM